MKLREFIKEKDGYISVEAAIVTSVVLILIAMGILLVIRRYGLNLEYTTAMETAAEEFNEGGFGDILRISKVLEELGKAAIK